MENQLKDWTAERIDALLRSGEAVRLGMGSRRACYALPGSGLCVKCYRSDEEIAEGKHPERPPFKVLPASVVKEIRRCRFDEKRNTCCQEYEYWKELQGRLPEKLAGVFPSTMKKMLLPSRGWCVVEELMENADGTPPEKFHEAWGAALFDSTRHAKLLSEFNMLAEGLVRHAVMVYDPQNILVQNLGDGSMRLRITDFEPASRAVISLDRLFLSVRRMKVARRLARYRKAYGIHEIATPHSIDRALIEKGVNVLCMKWGDYYTPEYVNRLYAGVKRNLHLPFRFVCVTDDASGLRPEVEAVPFPPDPKVPGRNFPRPWPNIFAKLALFQDGFAGLAGPTLFLDIDVLVTGNLDRFFLYRPGEFCIIHNWVERRKHLFRKAPDIGNSSCFRFEAGGSNGVWETFLREKEMPGMKERFVLGSQKFQTYAMMKTGRVNWWPSEWVCSFKRQLVPLFPLNKIFTPWRPSRKVSIVVFHGQPDLPQALEGYYLKYDKPVKPHLTCKPAKWIRDYWHE